MSLKNWVIAGGSGFVCRRARQGTGFRKRGNSDQSSASQLTNVGAVISGMPTA